MDLGVSGRQRQARFSAIREIENRKTSSVISKLSSSKLAVKLSDLQFMFCCLFLTIATAEVWGFGALLGVCFLSAIFGRGVHGRVVD